MARDDIRHPSAVRPFDDSDNHQSGHRDLEQQLDQDRNRMRRTYRTTYAYNNITGLDLTSLDRGEPDYAPHYDRYSAEGYDRDQALEHDPNRGRGLAYRHDYGRELYGREAYRDYRQDRPNYRGRGPKGYQRSDQHLLEDVCERLSDDPRIDASNIEVSVTGGEITLSGTVDSRASKRLAEDIVESCSGVRDVHNQLRISPPGENGSAQFNM